GVDFASRYEVLFRASDSWRARRDLTELLQSLPSQLQPLVEFDYLSVLLKKESAQEPSWYVLDEEDQLVRSLSREIPIEQAHVSWAFDHQQPAFVPGFQQEPRFLHASRLLNDRGLQSGCAVPMTTEQRRVGAMFFGRKGISPSADEEVRFLRLVAS